ncbi:hypothetical protein [Paenibacillus lentus]|uniref:Uncharacterized protein n=1 Tax=Paenibacillus lentus TaxID=1338368 RepID=A0A3Q8S552_9BACL|nr:hypothetical protein [Paenibacillus lentus]AZK47092.1 hypothetical protein EIM92_13780 [Paenibacillus lentus]
MVTTSKKLQGQTTANAANTAAAAAVTGIPFALRNIIVYKPPIDAIFGVYSLDAPSLISVNTLNVGGRIGGATSQQVFEIISGGFKFDFITSIRYSATWGYTVME